MSAKTNIWLATASALALLAGPALAQTTTTDPNVTIVNPDGPAEQTGEAVDNAAGATVDAAQDAAQATGQAVDNAADATADATQDAAQATGQAVDNAAETVTTTTPEVEVETDTATETEMETDTEEVAEGTPVEGQIFTQSPDTFLASTLMDGSVINPSGEEIGDVNDLVMTSEGMIEGVVIGVGGWLGIGQKDVAIEMGRIEITQDEDGDLAFQLNATREELEAAPEFQTQEDQEAEAAANAAGAGTAGGMSTTTSTPPATAAQ
jgi:sporulation protein YlmC with PRC-barrel domain